MFYIACVVYNKKIADVGSLKQFQSLAEKYTDVRIQLYDNSTNVDVLRSNRSEKYPVYIKYINNHGNIGLSKAYNKALGITNADDWIFWADDDTVFSEEFLENVYLKTKQDALRLIAGIVKTKADTILSPTNQNHKHQIVIKCGKEYRGLYCINSGLCIRRSVYDVIGKYDEHLFLDMIDYWLFDELRKFQMDMVFIAEGDVIQNFSGNSKSALQAKIKRFRIYAKDFNYYCRTEKRSNWYRYSVLIRRFLNILRTSFTRG